MIGRQDLCREIDTYRHSFDPDRADAQMMQEISSGIYGIFPAFLGLFF